MMRITSRPATCPASFVACRCASLKYAGTVMTTGCPPSITATTELVVPRSIPMILLMFTQSPLRLLSVLLYYAILASYCQPLMGAPACSLLVAAASDLSSFQDDLRVRLASV